MYTYKYVRAYVLFGVTFQASRSQWSIRDSRLQCFIWSWPRGPKFRDRFQVKSPYHTDGCNGRFFSCVYILCMYNDMYNEMLGVSSCCVTLFMKCNGGRCLWSAHAPHRYTINRGKCACVEAVLQVNVKKSTNLFN